MAEDLASLQFAIDSKAAKDAAENLNEMTEASKKAEAASADLAKQQQSEVEAMRRSIQERRAAREAEANARYEAIRAAREAAAAKQAEEEAAFKLASQHQALALAIKAVGFAAVTATGYAMLNFLKDAIRESFEFHESLVRMNAMLTVTQQRVGMNAEQMREFASSVADTYRVDNANVQAAIAGVLKYTDVRGENFRRMIELATEMSLVQGDLASNSNALARALENPARAMYSLRQMGISLNSSQRAMMRDLEEEGKLWEQQRMILELVEERFKGVSKEIDSSVVEALRRLQVEWNNLKEDIGNAISKWDALAEAINAVTKAVNALRNAGANLPEHIKVPQLKLPMAPGPFGLMAPFGTPPGLEFGMRGGLGLAQIFGDKSLYSGMPIDVSPQAVESERERVNREKAEEIRDADFAKALEASKKAQLRMGLALSNFDRDSKNVVGVWNRYAELIAKHGDALNIDVKKALEAELVLAQRLDELQAQKKASGKKRPSYVTEEERVQATNIKAEDAALATYFQYGYTSQDKETREFLERQAKDYNAMSQEMVNDAQKRTDRLLQIEMKYQDETKQLRIKGITDDRQRLEAQIEFESELLERELKLIEGNEERKNEIRKAATEKWNTEREKLEKSTDKFGAMLHDIGMTFTSAFENAIVSGGNFRDILDGIYQDLLRIIVRMLILKPLLESFDAMIKASGGFGLGNLLSFGSSAAPAASSGSYVPLSFDLSLGFAQGGVMTAYGPMPLHRYAGGGVASRPQMALFGEGSKPEAYVPLPDGRSIPVTMSGGDIVVNVHNYAPNSTARVERSKSTENQMQLDVIIETVESKMGSRIANGRGLAPVIERTYGLGRAPSTLLR